MIDFVNHKHLSHRNTLEQITDLRRMFRRAGFVSDPASDGQPGA
jgi:hypothetical protein